MRKSTTMSDWTDLNEIMRDLSVAQGCIVPASLETFGDSALPTVNIEEETEEAFYKSCGDVDFTKPPDYGLIQEMLTIVKDKKDPLDHDILLHSNLNPLSVEFVPGKKHMPEAVKNKRRQKNVAINSILEALEIKSPTKDKYILQNRVNMFRVKNSPKIVQQRCETTSSIPSDPGINSREYTPSALANVYYNKYVEKAKFKEQITEDIWLRAETQMKKLDESRQQKLDSPCSSRQSSNEGLSPTMDKRYGMYKVTLPDYRHFIIDTVEDCLVCDVLSKHGYRFQDEE